MRIPKKFLALGLIATLAVSCNKDTDTYPNDPTNTITDIVVAGEDFTILEAAVVKARLATTLASDGPFTVFAPDDNAFTASSITSVANFSEADLENILLYHTIGTKIPAANAPAGPNATVITASGDSVFVTSNTAGVFVNGIQLKTADVEADNGVIHVVNRVIMPPSGNVVETAVSSGLDSLVKAVTRATNEPGGYPQLTSILSNSIVTVFAPTNAAFTDLLNDLNLTDINDIPMATLLAVLQYHVISDRAFSSDLTNGSLNMLGMATTTINLTNGTNGGPTILGDGNGGNASNITATNITCTNGVVHLIDRVLVP